MTNDIQSDGSDPSFGNSCNNALRFIPGIHQTFMTEFNSSWKESFVNIDNGNNPLYTESSLNFAPFNIDNNFFKHSQPTTTTSAAKWGGYPSTQMSPNPITLGSMEWFPINSYPLVLDNYHNYHLIYNYTTPSTFTIWRFDCLSPAYPDDASAHPCSSGMCQTPFMYINGQNRINDGNHDGWIGCVAYSNPATTFHARQENPNISNIFPSKNLFANMFPNPSDGNYNLSYNLPSGKGNLIISDIMGNIVYYQSISGTNGIKSINISYLNNGIYYWKLVDDTGCSTNNRITILK